MKMLIQWINRKKILFHLLSNTHLRNEKLNIVCQQVNEKHKDLVVKLKLPLQVNIRSHLCLVSSRKIKRQAKWHLIQSFKDFKNQFKK